MSTNAKKTVGGRTTKSSARNYRPASKPTSKPKPRAKAKPGRGHKYRKGAE